MKKARKLKGNRTTSKFVQCSTLVNKSAVTRETVDGREYIRVHSYTLPDDVVMNGGLYPADEISKGFESLERTLAPVEHPERDGQFISAADPWAIANFHVGAHNENVKRENGRVSVDKVIDVQVAQQTERGRRLLDRINELETSDDPRPVHTSCGVWLEVETLDEPATNAKGSEYTWIARNMVFDHDAILLDSNGAATPSDGVGMAVNMETGAEVPVSRVAVPAEEVTPDPETDDGSLSVRAVMEQLTADLHNRFKADYAYVADLEGGQAILEIDGDFFVVPYRVDNGAATIVGIPLRVDRKVTYTPKQNHEDETMRKAMLNALRKAGVEVADDISDDDLLAQYNANASASIADTVAAAVAEAVKPLTEGLDAVNKRLNEGTEAEASKLADLIGNSDKFPGLDVDTAKLLPLDKLRSMAANLGKAHGVPLTGNDDGADEGITAPADMPE